MALLAVIAPIVDPASGAEEPSPPGPDSTGAVAAADVEVTAAGGNGLSMAQVSQLDSVYLRPATSTPMAFTGNVGACIAGSPGAAYQAATLDTINSARRLAGVGPVSLAADLDAKAQQAALMMDAADSLSHSPGAGWPCASAAGIEGASRSNLSLFRSGPAAIVGQLDDAGPSNAAVLHRWWLLHPAQQRLGAGATPGAGAIWVATPETQQAFASPDWVTWPTEGTFPEPLLPGESRRWSIFDYDGSADLRSASVSVSIDGDPVAVTLVHRNTGSLVWEIDQSAFRDFAHHTVDVSISGIGGRTSRYAYRVEVIDTPLFTTTVYLSDALASDPPSRKTGFFETGLDLMAGEFNGDARTDIAQRHGNRFSIVDDNGAPIAEIGYGKAGDEVFVGDWDCDGLETFAVRRGNVFYVKNSVSSGPADVVIGYGKAGDEVFVGDWNGNRCDTFAVRRGNQFFVRHSVSTGVADAVLGYGRAGDSVLVGDWNADGKDTFGVRRDATLYLRNDLRTGVAEHTFAFGRADDVLLVGDWDGDGVDTFGVAR